MTDLADAPIDDLDARRLASARLENVRLRAAMKHGLPESMTSRLLGSTPEEIEEDAEVLRAMLDENRQRGSARSLAPAAPSTPPDPRRLRSGSAPAEPFDDDPMLRTLKRVLGLGR